MMAVKSFGRIEIHLGLWRRKESKGDAMFNTGVMVWLMIAFWSAGAAERVLEWRHTDP